jgi:hypothetical protein
LDEQRWTLSKQKPRKKRPSCDEKGRLRTQNHLLLKPAPKLTVACFSLEGSQLAERYFVKADILHHGPDNGQTTHLGREGINLIGALSHIAEKAFDGIGGLNMTMHGRGKGIKRQQMLFILCCKIR